MIEANQPASLGKRSPDTKKTGEAGSATSRLYIYLLFGAGFLLLLVTTWIAPPRPVEGWQGLFLLLTIAAQMLFSYRKMDNERNLVHVITLGGGLLFGPAMAMWTVSLGIALGYLIRFLGNKWDARHTKPTSPFFLPVTWRIALFSIGLENTSLFLALFLTGWRSGWSVLASTGSEKWTEPLLPIIVFVLVHWFGALTASDRRSATFRRELVELGLRETIPLPFVWIAVIAYPLIGFGSLIALCIIPLLMMIIIYDAHLARSNLERHIRELAALNEISQVLRSNLELENLLAVLELQVSQFLGVENFYVALYDRQEQQLWYPMAFKRGQKVYWPPRPMMDRLTDRVIRDRQPILLPHHAYLEMARIGVPPGEEDIFAWMGVPLISPDGVIGCLAVLSYTPQIEFRNADLDLLTMLSGQVSVAIENALLHEQMERRTAQLETMSQITSIINDSLNPQDVLGLVCRSVTQVVGGAHSAIYTMDVENGELWLAHAHRLSEEYVQYNQHFSIGYDERTRCLRTGRPHLVQDLSTIELSGVWLGRLVHEGIRAYGDFPLITPEGQIGYLTVFFDEIHIFSPEEVELLQTIAAQAALVISYTRLHARTDMALARRAHQLAILESIGRALAAAIRSERLFEMILDFTLEFTNSPWGSIALLDSSSQFLEVKAARGYPHTPPPLPINQGIVGRAVRMRQTIYVPDISQEADYIDYSVGLARSQLCLPIAHDEQVLGVISLESPQLNAFSANDQAFVSQVANQAAVALTNAVLYADVARGRNQMDAVINSVHEGILMIAPDGRVLLSNYFIQQLAGASVAPFIGQRLSELPIEVQAVLGYSRAELVELESLLSHGRLTSSTRQTIKFPSDTPERVLERTSSVVHDREGEVIGWMVHLRDITDEFRLAEARELITETLVHDLRSPISAVLGALDVIQDAIGHEPVQRSNELGRAIDLARRGAQRVLALVDSMLDIARLESGNIETALAPIDIYELTGMVLGNFTQQSLEFDLTLHNEIQPDCPYVFADREKVTRVLTNLVDNAVKFTPSGGKITIAARLTADDMLLVQIHDTGPGIPDEYRDKIFERFSQVPGVHGRRRGSGLGLTFCRLAVEAHGGHIWVEPSPGGGSHFSFTLPIAGPRS